MMVKFLHSAAMRSRMGLNTCDKEPSSLFSSISDETFMKNSFTYVLLSEKIDIIHCNSLKHHGKEKIRKPHVKYFEQILCL